MNHKDHYTNALTVAGHINKKYLDSYFCGYHEFLILYDLYSCDML